MANILRKQNKMINNSNPVTADEIPYGTGTVKDALDGLQVESGQFDLSSTYFDTYKTVAYTKQGCVVMLSINVKSSANISADGVMGVVPNDLKPATRMWVTGSVGSFYLEPTGDFKTLQALTANKWIYLTMIYLI